VAVAVAVVVAMVAATEEGTMMSPECVRAFNRYVERSARGGLLQPRADAASPLELARVAFEAGWLAARGRAALGSELIEGVRCETNVRLMREKAERAALGPPSPPSERSSRELRDGEELRR
jgi:hypothetical protein